MEIMPLYVYYKDRENTSIYTQKHIIFIDRVATGFFLYYGCAAALLGISMYSFYQIPLTEPHRTISEYLELNYYFSVDI